MSASERFGDVVVDVVGDIDLIKGVGVLEAENLTSTRGFRLYRCGYWLEGSIKSARSAVGVAEALEENVKVVCLCPVE